MSRIACADVQGAVLSTTHDSYLHDGGQAMYSSKRYTLADRAKWGDTQAGMWLNASVIPDAPPQVEKVERKVDREGEMIRSTSISSSLSPLPCALSPLPCAHAHTTKSALWVFRSARRTLTEALQMRAHALRLQVTVSIIPAGNDARRLSSRPADPAFRNFGGGGTSPLWPSTRERQGVHRGTRSISVCFSPLSWAVPACACAADFPQTHILKYRGKWTSTRCPRGLTRWCSTSRRYPCLPCVRSDMVLGRASMLARVTPSDALAHGCALCVDACACPHSLYAVQGH